MLNNLVRNLALPKYKPGIFGSRLKQWNLLKQETKISEFTSLHHCNEKLSSFFDCYNGLCFCNNVDGLMMELGYEHRSDERRLFIDWSKASLKVVLLYNSDNCPSIPVAHAVQLKKTNETMKLLLDALQYPRYSWKICGDLKVISLVLGLQLGYTISMCFLCLWNSRDDSNHFSKVQWEPREALTAGRFNVKYVPLADPKNFLFPPLYIELGLMKCFVRAMYH